MIRNTIVIAALLGLVTEAECKNLQKAVDQEEMQDLNNDFKNGLVELDQEADVEEELDEHEDIQLQSQATTEFAKMEKGCWAGIQRWSSKGNSWATFNRAHGKGEGLWKDPEFGDDAETLYWSNYLKDKSDMNDLKKGVQGWKRPTELFKEKPSFWGPKGYPIPQGVSQRSLGDCWFLSGAAALAEVPARVKRIAWNDSYDQHGAFRFYFWVKNKWHGINIDDRLPAKKGYYGGWRTWSTARSKNGAWWMPLLEKAYAKLDQNYERIIGGMGYEALRTLTGMPTTYISNKKGKDVKGTYKTLKALASQNYPMTTPCCNQGRHGLVSGHAYTLLDVLELSNGVQLAKVRNPWSSERYNGDWSDKSSLWTDKLKKEAGYVNANDGSFFLPFKLYAEEFWGASVALYQPYAGFKQIEVSQSKRSASWTVTNPAEQEMYIVGETYSGRNFPRTCNPGNNYVLYMYDSDNNMVGTYGFIGRRGFGFIGKAGQKLPKGDYKLTLVNQSAGSNTAHVTLNFYWRDQEGKASAE